MIEIVYTRHVSVQVVGIEFIFTHLQTIVFQNCSILCYQSSLARLVVDFISMIHHPNTLTHTHPHTEINRIIHQSDQHFDWLQIIKWMCVRWTLFILPNFQAHSLLKWVGCLFYFQPQKQSANSFLVLFSGANTAVTITPCLIQMDANSLGHIVPW